MKDHKNITNDNQRLVKCVPSLVKVFYFYLIDCAEKIIGFFSSRRPRKHLQVRSRLFVPHSQPASQPAGPKWRPVPEELVHKTLKSDFPKNDTISMRSPSSNAIIWRGNVFSRDSSNADAAVLWMKEISEPDWNDFISAELISVSCLLTLLLHVQNWIFNALQSLHTYKACKGVNYTKVRAILW